ncbi:helix-turn-helix transcriptional regulator [Acetobacter senegalensis]|uniref:ArsR family transcriptional regulator n=1 Tax=Acetobacter tropicalis TaxID=104102 RepID=A0A252A165_9PROT|nr:MULTISPECIES: helix-turn-helix domain-containing protein [Acetobacter]MCP1197269.1 helix-turn-helix transcriptional regulator [Acetobacter senegalensis]OUI80895.1 ArsR family transcriptional regulator [Acetobacter tropicalis]
MNETITHLKVPVEDKDRLACLGPDGAAAHVIRTMKMVQGCWKLPILFRLYAAPSLRHTELKRDLFGVSQKMLTQHLRELEKDGLIQRHDFEEKRRHVEYRLSDQGQNLMCVFLAMRDFSVKHSAMPKF